MHIPVPRIYNYMHILYIYIYSRMSRMLLCDVREYSAAHVSTRNSVIFFLSHPDLGSKTFLYMLVGSTTLPRSLASRWTEHCWKLDCFKKLIGAIECNQFLGCYIRDPSEDDLENNSQKPFNANSRAGELSMAKST